jgi:putative (di)nucleoside polyphosphate hydrolase
MLLNRENLALVGERARDSQGAWQMPQGGIKSVDPKACVLRELEEEFGISHSLVDFVARCPKAFRYDQPPDRRPSEWKSQWRGQEALYFLARFTGTDQDICISSTEPEFKDWRWASPFTLPEITVWYKKELYRSVLECFEVHISSSQEDHE